MFYFLKDTGGEYENVVPDRRVPSTLHVFASETDLQTRTQYCNSFTSNLCKKNNGGCEQVRHLALFIFTHCFLPTLSQILKTNLEKVLSNTLS